MIGIRNAANPLQLLTTSGWDMDYSQIQIKINRDTGVPFAYDTTSDRSYSIKKLETLANDGDANAQCALADYHTGEGKGFNPAEANRWYEKAAIQGHPKAQGYLAGSFLNGLGLDKNIEKAEYWAKKAVEQNSPTGMVILSQCYLTRDDFANVIYWLERAKELGFPDPDGLLELAKLLHQSQTQTREGGFSEDLLGLSSMPSANKIKEQSQRIDKNKVTDFQNYIYKKGISIYKDKRALSSLASDIFVGNERLVNALKIVIDGNVAKDLSELKVQNLSLHESGIKRILNIFIDNYGLEKSRTIDAFYVLVTGLGMSTRTLLDD